MLSQCPGVMPSCHTGVHSRPAFAALLDGDGSTGRSIAITGIVVGIQQPIGQPAGHLACHFAGALESAHCLDLLALTTDLGEQLTRQPTDLLVREVLAGLVRRGLFSLNPTVRPRPHLLTGRGTSDFTSGGLIRTLAR